MENEEKVIDYKEKTIRLLNKVSNQRILKRIYKLLEYLYIKEESSNQLDSVFFETVFNWTQFLLQVCG